MFGVMYAIEQLFWLFFFMPMLPVANFPRIAGAVNQGKLLTGSARNVKEL